MSYIIPVHEKNDKCSLDNYNPVSLLPICGKMFLMMFFKKKFLMMFSIPWIYNNLLTPNQSGFKPNEFCINRLWSILSTVPSIYSDFGHNPSLEVRGIFLDISKPFDKVLHEGLT